MTAEQRLGLLRTTRKDTYDMAREYSKAEWKELLDKRPSAEEVRDKYFGELKPCPFCGGKARFGVVHSPDYESPMPDEGGEYIECTNNRCRASTMLIFPTMADAKPFLIEKWNSRI